MIRKKTWIVSLLFLFILGYKTNSIAAPRWYKIEILLLEHQDKAGVLLEDWPFDPGYPSTQKAHYLKAASENPNDLILLNKTEIELNHARNNLIKRLGSRILLHTGWRQQLDDSIDTPIRIGGGRNFHQSIPDLSSSYKLMEFDGTLTILLSRYLHVMTDLVFHKPMKVLSETKQNDTQPMQRLMPLANENHWESQNARLSRFRIQEKRKLKKNEVVYIDHPLYGLLITISNDSGPTEKPQESV